MAEVTDWHRALAGRLVRCVMKQAANLLIDSARGNSIVEVPVPGPVGEDAVAEMLAEMDEERGARVRPEEP